MDSEPSGRGASPAASQPNGDRCRARRTRRVPWSRRRRGGRRGDACRSRSLPGAEADATVPEARIVKPGRTQPSAPSARAPSSQRVVRTQRRIRSASGIPADRVARRVDLEISRMTPSRSAANQSVRTAILHPVRSGESHPLRRWRATFPEDEPLFATGHEAATVTKSMRDESQARPGICLGPRAETAA